MKPHIKVSYTIFILIFYNLAFTKPFFCKAIKKDTNQITQEVIPSRTCAEWNFIVYMANNNSLHKYGVNNFNEMVSIGSNEKINIIVQIDTPGTLKNSRFYIKKHNPVLMESQQNTVDAISGTPESLFSFVAWSLKNFSARNNALILWNHGTGIKDPTLYELFMQHRDEFFEFNYKSSKMELNRTILSNEDFSKSLKAFAKARGIAFNQTANTYLTNQALREVLGRIKTELLDGNKLDVLVMDACHMAMLEICSEINPEDIRYFVASQEIEPGGGYNYQYVLEPLTRHSLSPKDLAQHIVSAYDKEYGSIFVDHTQSAIKLKSITELETNVDSLAKNLLKLIGFRKKTVMTGLKEVRYDVTEFFDNDYIDLADFYLKISKQCKTLQENSDISDELDIVETLEQTSELALQGLRTLRQCVVANVAGKALPCAQGLSIYFPRRLIHESYKKTAFANKTSWLSFLESFFSGRGIFRNTAEHQQSTKRSDRVKK
ncbi:MAG: hypothetical protein H6679_01125 [Epsilonproteobacteria bacterium]|nr:hypothetical protein [Campylobacterota bacterium]